MCNTTKQFGVVHVDDDKTNADSVRSFVENYFEGAVVEAFLYGDQAWKVLEHTTPDIVITDLYMPRTNSDYAKHGFRLLSCLSEKNVECPVVVMAESLTVHKYEAYVRQLFGSRLNLSFIEKPLNTK